MSPDVHDACWSSDNSKLLAISEGPNGAGHLAPAMSNWLVSLADESHPQPLADLPATIEAASWVPGRNSILYLAQAKHSPLAGAGKASTLFLLLQGEGDTTDPLGQSKEMYRALRQAGAPVELVTYPRDNHGPLALAIYDYPVPGPWHGFDGRRRIVAFIQKAFEGVP